MRPIQDLKEKHAGRPVAVLGGGPNLRADLERIPADSILIGINDHASQITFVDYMCFADHPDHKNSEFRKMVNDHRGRRLTFIPGYSDWDINIPCLYNGITATFATWAACYMGGDPVLLCGMDLFRTGVYFHSAPDAHHVCQDYPLEHHLRPWRQCLTDCEHPERIRAVSGPLDEIFGKY